MSSTGKITAWSGAFVFVPTLTAGQAIGLVKRTQPGLITHIDDDIAAVFSIERTSHWVFVSGAPVQHQLSDLQKVCDESCAVRKATMVEFLAAYAYEPFPFAGWLRLEESLNSRAVCVKQNFKGRLRFGLDSPRFSAGAADSLVVVTSHEG